MSPPVTGMGNSSLITNSSSLDIPPPGAVLKTVKLALPGVAMSAAVIAACSCVLETKVVVRSTPFQRTVETPLTKLVPLTVSVKAGPPAVVDAGFKLLSVATGLGAGSIVKVRALDSPPPGALLKTVTLAVPAEAISAAVIAACSCVLETKVVVRSTPFQRTIETPPTKFEPLTTSVKAGPPAVVDAGFKLVRVGTGLGAGSIVKVRALDSPPPGALLSLIHI